MLQAIDIYILARLSLEKDARPKLAEIASDLHLSLSEVHRSLKRSELSRLLIGHGKEACVNRHAFLELLVHGFRYVFPAEPGREVRGLPTGWAAPPLNKEISQNSMGPVWPDALGKVRGFEVQPLHKSAPLAAAKNKALYEILALIDALRLGKARERSLAEQELKLRIIREGVDE